MRSFRLSFVVAGALAAVAVPACAQTYYNRDGYAYGPGVDYAPRPYYAPRTRVASPPGYYEGRSVHQIYQDEYHASGTLGREGLGADPRHPEGPGNQSLGGFR